MAACKKQVVNHAHHYNLSAFQQYLNDLIIACDQPIFEELLSQQTLALLIKTYRLYPLAKP